MTYDAERGALQLILTGDALVQRPLAQYREPQFLALRDLLSSGDAALTTLEAVVTDGTESPGYVTGGIHMRIPPQILGDLRWLGIGMVATATNHGFDFGESGIRAHLRHLERSGLTHAGLGLTMADARRPRYLDTPAGRIALISATTSGPPALYAQHQWRDGAGRPGANMIRYTSHYEVDGELFDALRRLRDEFALGGSRKPGYGERSLGLALAPDTEDSFYLGDLHDRFQYPAPAGYRIVRAAKSRRRLVPDAGDLAENLQQIADARRMADWVVVSLHTHESGAAADEPAEVATAFAHAAIEAGADVFYGNGPNRVRGVEIYRNRPIIYSLGTFIHESHVVERIQQDNYRRAGLDPWTATPADFHDNQYGRELAGEREGRFDQPSAWQSVVMAIEFDGRELREMRLHPVELGYRKGRAQRGRPLLADGAAAGEMLARFQKVCEPYGTKVLIDGDMGRIRA
jgi:poly-gamma-glutamate synthesis protein (capsule biosynthesis protein)